jgi:mannose-6-phosphate isomerase-like protein (cupin superfamily)|tara:strand:+ start:717 stop:1115 length:399 start_codon:yes stop_codon:yes gene_type:complete
MLRKANIIEKPWGHEEIWASTSRYAGKILVINKGHRLSRQYHNVKEETIMILDGTLICEEGPREVGGEVVRHVMDPGTIFHVTPGTIHRFCAEETNVRLVEVSSPEIEDVVRLEDDYRRVTDVPRPPRTSGK